MSAPTQTSASLVIATAGHIDHGKTTLVWALTGMETDRLAQEKLRGISIDLGFAHMRLPNGATVAFVDVPGHERFVRNMVAGVAGAHSVVLVVAATESVMPQTREHLDICRLLGMRTGVVALTKVDAVDDARLRQVTSDIRQLCSRTFLAGAPIVEVSATKGIGIDTLRSALALLVATPQSSDGRIARVCVDRRFAMRGYGTVVTGTLTGDSLRVGSDILLHPSLRTGRVRSMQIHGTQVDSVAPGQRVAINIAGLDTSEIERGDVLTLADTATSTHVLDVWVEWLDVDAVPRGRMEFLLHVGTAEVPVSFKVLERRADTARTLGRLWLPKKLLVCAGDRFILRRPSPARTVGGGEVIDPFPPLRLNRGRTVARLHTLAATDLAARVSILVSESPAGRQVDELSRCSGHKLEAVLGAVRRDPNLLLVHSGSLVITKTWLGERRKRLLDWLAVFHQHNPSLAGAPIAQARLGLTPELATVVFDGFPGVRLQGQTVALTTHRPQFTQQESRLLARIESTFREAGLHPPTLNEALQPLGAEAKMARGLLEALVRAKRLVRVSEELVFHAEAVNSVRAVLTANKGRRFSVPEFKDWTRMSRKYAIPFLEYLDRERLTRRDGDARISL